jgi:hypothetical protein
MNSNRCHCSSGRLALPDPIGCRTLRSIRRLEDMGILGLLGHDVIGHIIVRPALCRKRLETRVLLMSSSVQEINIKKRDIPTLTSSH